MKYMDPIEGSEPRSMLVLFAQSRIGSADYYAGLLHGIVLGREAEKATVWEKKLKKSLSSEIPTKKQKSPSDILDRSKPEQEVLLNPGGGRIDSRGPEETFRARVESIGDSHARCIVSFHGIPLPLSFPTSVIAHHNLAEGSQFEWLRKKGRHVRPSDLRPVLHDSELTSEEEERLRKFVERGRSHEDLLDGYTE